MLDRVQIHSRKWRLPLQWNPACIELAKSLCPLNQQLKAYVCRKLSAVAVPQSAFSAVADVLLDKLNRYSFIYVTWTFHSRGLNFLGSVQENVQDPLFWTRCQQAGLHLCIAAVVSGESGDDIYEQVKVVIEEQVGPSVWVSTNQPL